MQEEAQVLLELDSWDHVVSCINYFQPRMRGWFPRRCAVEAVDHYDSCQVLLPPMAAKIISDPFQVGKRKESCKETNQASQKKSRETKKKK